MMPSVPSEPTTIPARSYPGRSATGAAEREDLSPARDDLQAQDVVRHVAVLERVRAPGVGGGVPPDGGDHLARGIRGEEVAAALDGPRQGEVDDARLHHRVAVPDVHLEDAVHAVQTDHHAALRRGRAADEPRPRAAQARSGLPPPGSGARRSPPPRSSAGGRRGRACPCSRRACRTRRPDAHPRRRRSRRGPRSRGGRLPGGGPCCLPGRDVGGGRFRKARPTPRNPRGGARVDGARPVSGSSRCRRTSAGARCRPGRARRRRASPGRR